VISLYFMIKIAFWYYRRVKGIQRKTVVEQMGVRRKKTRDAEVKRILGEYDSEFPSFKLMDTIVTKYNTLRKLRDALDSKAITSKELVLTYVYRAATIGMKLNALADVMFKNAIKMAEECDKELEKGQSRGFLHGIPISLKEQILVKDTVCTLGI